MSYSLSNKLSSLSDRLGLLGSPLSFWLLVYTIGVPCAQLSSRHV
jgi:hypothetical protein